jgi:diguanylate cyclase (GGDEF)-like protein/PAS domain S-box-containing protein
MSVAVLVFAALLDRVVQQRYQAQERAEVLSRASTMRARLEGQLNSCLSLNQVLVSYVATHPDITQAQFADYARRLIAGHSAVRSVRLARDTVVSHVYPLAGHRAQLGRHLLDLPSQRSAVQRALRSHGTVVAGPVRLAHGGAAFISRTPIYVGAGKPQRYWGLVSVVIDAGTLLQHAGLDGDPGGGVVFALRVGGGPRADGTVFYGPPGLFSADPVTQQVAFPNGSWALAAVRHGGWDRLAPHTWWLRGGGVLIALLVGTIVWLWTRYPDRLWHEVQRTTFELLHMHEQLEDMVAERTTALTRANQALRESEARLAEAQQIARLGNWVWDINANELYWSDEVYRIFGLEPQQFGATYDAFLEHVHPDDRGLVTSAVREALTYFTPYDIDHRVVLPDGGVRVVHEQARVHVDENGRPLRMAGTVQDITERKRSEMQMEHMAYHDPLTGLPNRALLRDRLEHAMAKARRNGGGLALLFLDLDRFKNVNDSLGHDTGDRLLVQVTERLAEQMRDEDTLARLGGDEFTVLLEDVHEVDQVTMFAGKLRQVLQRSFDLDGREIFITGSIGISLYPDDGSSADALMKHADAAMYRAKELGRDEYQFFARDMSLLAHERLALESAMRLALVRDEFRLQYQPIVDPASGKVAALEALIRWEHPERGLMAPDQFIPLAEETSLALDIGQWVLHEACGQSRAWQDADIPPVRIMVNLSPRQFSQGDLARDVAQLLVDNGLSPANLGLEITEHLLLKDDQRVDAILRQLRAMEVPVAIDDFGKGHSAFSYLKRLSVATLKIDRSFVHDLTTNANDAAIAEAIIAMGHKLNLWIVAEGVETADQAQLLLGYGCDLAQGFYYSPPVAAAEIPALLEAHGVTGGCCERQPLPPLIQGA